MSRGIGRTLAGKYRLTDYVASGGMAAVFRADEVDAEGNVIRPVAIKRMLPGLTADPHFRSLFEEEARLVAQLSGPHIVDLYEMGVDGIDEVFLAMEWIEGTDLGAILAAARDHAESIAWRDVASLGLSVASALSTAHKRPEAPVFHRDVSPSNVLVSVDGDAKLSDFGLARAMDRITITTPGAVVGKLAYIAPELLGRARHDARTDLYSLGITLWEALAGRRLFQGMADVQLFVAVGREAVPPIDDHREDLPPELVDVIARLTARRVDERYPTAEAAIAAISALEPGDRREELGGHVQRARRSAPPPLARDAG